MVDGLRIAWVRQLADCPGQTIARTRVRRRARLSGGIHLRLPDVSAVSALGRAAQEQTRGGRTATLVLVAALRAFVGRRSSRQRRTGIWPETGKHRPESARLF